MTITLLAKGMTNQRQLLHTENLLWFEKKQFRKEPDDI
jgi:hypothetical protein